MKVALISLFTGILLSFSAQVPNWTQYTCDGNSYSMYKELSKGKAVVINFSSLWCAGSAVAAESTEDLWQNTMTENVKVFGFIHEDQGFNLADCDDANLWEAIHGISYPTFINVDHVLQNYINKYTQSGATTLPWFLLFLPDHQYPEASQIAYSGHDLNTLYHILNDQWLQSSGITNVASTNKILVKILDHMGRETDFKANTPLIYVYDDGSTEKVFTIGQ
tara:strand:- start:4521 stop:5183 length:663 start_codon:yes stop_codon:yes gene_type:complete